MIVLEFNHRVRITFRSLHVMDRIAEFKQITEWIDELTVWQPNQFEINIVRIGDKAEVEVWFREERHADVEVDMSYRVKVPEAWSRMQWCRQMFGDPVKHGRWWRNLGYLHFNDEQCYILYCMRWA